MAAFSRGFFATLHHHTFRLPCSLRTALLNPRLRCSRPPRPNRLFSSTILRRLSTAPRQPAPPSGSSYITRDPVVRTVIQTREPVIIFREPPWRSYLWRVYAAGSIFAGIGAYSFYFASTLPEGLPWFVRPLYMFLGVAFFTIGVHIYQRPVRRIKLLEVIPGALGGRPQLRLRVRRSPFSNESVIDTDLWEPVLSGKTHPIREEIVEANRARHQSILIDLENRSIVSKGWEIAARWLEQKFTSTFLTFKFFCLQFPITHVEVEGVKWKLDCMGDLREEGKAIDRIISEE